MNIYNDIDTVLSAADVPYYHSMPEFSANNEPEKYIAYTVKEKPHFFASGENKATCYWVAVNVITPMVDGDLYSKIKALFKSAGYIFQEGWDAGELPDFPYKKMYIMDFIKTV